MIGRLKGILLEKEEGEVLLDVNGVGYEIEVPTSLYYQLPETGNSLLLYTHFVVREDAHHLYGFMQEPERALFRLLIKVNGVGPKMALGLLSSMGSDQFVMCVANNDVNTLVKLPGVGRKTAERLLIEMRDRLKGWVATPDAEGKVQPVVAAGVKGAMREAESALISLGYKPQEAARAVISAVAALEQEEIAPATEQMIRIALKQLGKG